MQYRCQHRITGEVESRRTLRISSRRIPDEMHLLWIGPWVGPFGYNATSDMLQWKTHTNKMSIQVIPYRWPNSLAGIVPQNDLGDMANGTLILVSSCGVFFAYTHRIDPFEGGFGLDTGVYKVINWAHDGIGAHLSCQRCGTVRKCGPNWHRQHQHGTLLSISADVRTQIWQYSIHLQTGWKYPLRAILHQY